MFFYMEGGLKVNCCCWVYIITHCSHSITDKTFRVVTRNRLGGRVVDSSQWKDHLTDTQPLD